MSKYIPADKLLAEIERLNSLVPYENNDRHDDGLHDAYKAVKNVIDSLQQEQPEFVNEIWHKVSEEANLTRPVVLSDGDKYMSPPCTFPFKDMPGFVKAMNKRYKADYTIWAYMDDLLNMSSLQQERPEVDLEKEIDQLKMEAIGHGHTIEESKSVMRAFERIARRFYELGLNARKEK